MSDDKSNIDYAFDCTSKRSVIVNRNKLGVQLSRRRDYSLPTGGHYLEALHYACILLLLQFYSGQVIRHFHRIYLLTRYNIDHSLFP